MIRPFFIFPLNFLTLIVYGFYMMFCEPPKLVGLLLFGFLVIVQAFVIHSIPPRMGND